MGSAEPDCAQATVRSQEQHYSPKRAEQIKPRQSRPDTMQGRQSLVQCRRCSLDSRTLLNKSLVLVKYFICGKVSKLFYHHDL